MKTSGPVAALKTYGDFELKPCVRCAGKKFSKPAYPDPALLAESAGRKLDIKIIPHVQCLSCKTVQYLHLKDRGWSTNGWCGDPHNHFHVLNGTGTTLEISKGGDAS